MKKFCLYLIALVIFFPIKVKAVELNKVTIIGRENVTIGEPFTESILITFNDLQKSYSQSQGILYLKYEIKFDNTILSITNLESPDWDTIIYQENNKYYVLSIINTENNLQNYCVNSFLYCGDYSATIEFSLAKTDSTESLITIDNLEFALLDLSVSTSEYTMDDIIIKKNENSEVHSLTINQTETTTGTNLKENIIIDISPEEINEKISQALNQEPIITSRSSNLLNKLEITGYDLDFNKYKNNYTITIPTELTTLDLQIITEDENATYKVLGNENLINNNQITIEVTSTDNQVNNYIINVKKISSITDENVISSQKQTIKEIFIKYERYIKYATIILGSILIILIIIKIISKIKDKKIEDLTNKF